MNEEQAKGINNILHRIARVTGNMEKRRQVFIETEQRDIQELSLARAELLDLVDSVNGKEKE